LQEDRQSDISTMRMESKGSNCNSRHT
jgi:hypothetical protein